MQTFPWNPFRHHNHNFSLLQTDSQFIFCCWMYEQMCLQKRDVYLFKVVPAPHTDVFVRHSPFWHVKPQKYCWSLEYYWVLQGPCQGPESACPCCRPSAPSAQKQNTSMCCATHRHKTTSLCLWSSAQSPPSLPLSHDASGTPPPPPLPLPLCPRWAQTPLRHGPPQPPLPLPQVCTGLADSV